MGDSSRLIKNNGGLTVQSALWGIEKKHESVYKVEHRRDSGVRSSKSERGKGEIRGYGKVYIWVNDIVFARFLPSLHVQSD